MRRTLASALMITLVLGGAASAGMREGGLVKTGATR